MRVGVSTASLFLRKNNEEALPLLQSLGVKTAEVFLTSFSEYGLPFADTLLKNKGDMEINSLHILNTQFEPQLFNAHPRVKADAFFWLNKVLESANILDVPYYTFHGTARIKRGARSGINDDFPKMIRSFEEIILACEKQNVKLCLENVEWATYNRIGVFERLKKELPTLGGVLDVKQARISEYSYEEYVKEMEGRLAYVHISDVDDKGKMCLPGRGSFDFDTLILRLKDVGFDGALIIEVYTDNYKREEELKTACEYMQERLYKYGCLQ